MLQAVYVQVVVQPPLSGVFVNAVFDAPDKAVSVSESFLALTLNVCEVFELNPDIAIRYVSLPSSLSHADFVLKYALVPSW